MQKEKEKHATSEYAPCPNCGHSAGEKVNFTWWGGALGPRLLNHVKCGNCGTSYNGKSGNSNTTNIIIYSVVILAAVFVLMMVIQGSF